MLASFVYFNNFFNKHFNSTNLRPLFMTNLRQNFILGFRLQNLHLHFLKNPQFILRALRDQTGNNGSLDNINNGELEAIPSKNHPRLKQRQPQINRIALLQHNQNETVEQRVVSAIDVGGQSRYDLVLERVFQVDHV